MRRPGPPHHGPHHHHHHDVLYNAEERASAEKFARLLERFAEQISVDSAVALTSGLTATLPPEVDVVVRFERMAHGPLALRISAEWGDQPDDAVPAGSLAELLG